MGQIVSVTLMVEKKGTEVPMPWNEDCSFSFSSSFRTQFSPQPLVCFTVLLSMLPPRLPLAPEPQSSLWLWSAGRDLRAVDCGTLQVKGVLEFNLVDFTRFTDQQTEPEGGKPSSSQKKEPEFCIF